MKNIISYCFLLFIFICTISYLRVNSYSLPLRNKTIYIDPGHGGVDSGAIYKDILEKDINLLISYELMYKLESLGASVYMTRYDDYDLSNIDVSRRKKSDFDNRIKLINNSNANMYLSIHLNSIESSKWSGVQIFYDNINKENSIIAKYIKESFNSKRDISIIKDKYMYNKVKIPGVLLELGFISNANDRKKLMNSNEREKIIDSITKGIINYYNR